jgi:predicted Zn-dependent peptidase
MIRSILLFFSLFFSVSQLCGQNIEQVNYTYDSYPNDPLGTRKYVLKNGLTVFTSVNTNEPRIYTCIAIAAGSKHDPKNNTGLAHYLEHMLFKGTDLYGTSSFEKEQGYLKQIESLYEKYNKSAEESLRNQLYRRIDSLSYIAANIAIANEYD